jgi:hypothetical protein
MTTNTGAARPLDRITRITPNICAQWIDLPDSCSRTYQPDLAEWIVPLEPRHIMAGAPQDLLMQGHERAAVPGLIGTAWFRRRLK